MDRKLIYSIALALILLGIASFVMTLKEKKMSVEVAIGKNGKAVITDLSIKESRTGPPEPKPISRPGLRPYPKPCPAMPDVPVTTITEAHSPRPDTCGDGFCLGETFESCPLDCGEKIYPYYADKELCLDSKGNEHPSMGEGAARWFLWNNCTREKYYRVVPGEPVIFNACGDTCSGCVCYHPDFTVWEYENSRWEPKQRFKGPDVKGVNVFFSYLPQSFKIKVRAAKCFYLDVYKKKDECFAASGGAKK